MVKLLIIRMRSVRQKFGPWYFLAVRRSTHALQLQTGILRPGSLVILMRAHLDTYPAKFFYSNSRPHKCRTRNYVSTSAENDPAMAGPAGPAGPVLAPMERYIHQPRLRHEVGTFIINVCGELSAMISTKQVVATHNTIHSPCMCQHHDNKYVDWIRAMETFL